MVRKVFLLLFVLMVSFQAYKKRERFSLWWTLQKAPPAWAEEQIRADFVSFQTITQESLDQTFQKIKENHGFAYRYRIVNGNVYRLGEDDPLGRAAVFEKILRRIQRSKKLPDVDFIVCMADGVPESYHAKDFWICEKQAPLLAWAKRKEIAPFVVLIPDILTTKEMSWHHEIETVNEKYRQIPWSKRKEVAFWRGASNDKAYTLENVHQKPRFIISFLSTQFPQLIDAGFCRVYPEEVAKAVANMIVGNVPVANHLIYKYLPVLDGYMCTFPGYQWRLLSGSVSFKQESDEIQYFYSALKPFVHYVPIKNDMSDLVEKIHWAKGHDEECRAIAETGRKFALQNLMPNSIYAYFYWVLERYASLQEFTLSQVPLTSAWQERDHSAR